MLSFQTCKGIIKLFDFYSLGRTNNKNKSIITLQVLSYVSFQTFLGQTTHPYQFEDKNNIYAFSKTIDVIQSEEVVQTYFHNNLQNKNLYRQIRMENVLTYEQKYRVYLSYITNALSYELIKNQDSLKLQFKLILQINLIDFIKKILNVLFT
ncbi:unnamed protein product [Paramecium pentaurelia]|uniref:Uncharacterized protein n=1 Tax=Paramecium pentaurelia TaxID=43138 RepID=A0A8S1YIX3_9CILI|nr:unnamed protein product [Paramecium pentaurelia]